MTGSKKEIEENIIKEINSSGFPLEVYVSIILNKNGWNVKPSFDYFDEKINDYREADILANKRSELQNILNFLVIECKKSSEKPWVFIKQKRIGRLSENLNIACPFQKWVYYEILEKTMNSHHYSKRPICTYYIVPFTNDEKKNLKLSQSIFHAKNQVITVMTRLVNQRNESFRDFPDAVSKFFYYPIIVFDGTLYSATINEDHIDLHEENHLLLSVERELPKKRSIHISENTSSDQSYKPYLIDIVKKEYFEEFIHIFEQYYSERKEDIQKSFKQ